MVVTASRAEVKLEQTGQDHNPHREQLSELRELHEQLLELRRVLQELLQEGGVGLELPVGGGERREER